MRSWRSALVAVYAGAAACGTDASSSAPECAGSILTYQNFGEPFLLDWCRGCHSSSLPDGMRQGAPLGVDFDELDTVRAYSSLIQLRAAGATPSMPPAAGPATDERAMLAEWITCGTR